MERLRKENLILWIVVGVMAIVMLSMMGPGCVS